MVAITDTAELGKLIRTERKKSRLTQVELAGLSGVGVTYISHLENGKPSSEIGKAIQVLLTLGIDLYASRRGQ